MIVYSQKIIRFIHEIKKTIKKVLGNEVLLKVYGDRFYNKQQTVSYPIKIVIFNNKSMLGYFDANFLELGFHESLMFSSIEQLHNVIRHELAHYITFMNYGEAVLPHGLEFKAFCQSMGWNEEVYKATTCLETQESESIAEELGICRRIKKLMALASSKNKNEAEQAMIKSQQLLLKHHIDSRFIENEEEEKIFLKRILKQKKENAKMRTIARIVETFFVNVIYTRAGDFTYLEICGNAVNIEIAEHVANVLSFELENLWQQAQQQANLKGMMAKNSFFLGIAKGYCSKIQTMKQEYNQNIKNALMVIEKKLVDAKAMIYRRLSISKRQANFCTDASAIGEHMGRQLNIQSAINKSSKNTVELIAY